MAASQADYFLKIDGIQGESQDDKHQNEIQLTSFSFGVTNAGTGSSGMGSGSGKANIQDFKFTKLADNASPNLFQACCNGKHFDTATLTVRKAGEDALEYLVYTLSEVFVSSYTTAGQSGGGIAQESGSMNFSKIQVQYTPQSADGSAGAQNTKGYDVKANKTF
jgi:type VI secretion system secreted protein Hcp